MSLTASSPTNAARERIAVDLMMRFADRTGLISGETPQRYLWTDAFAVCNFLGLARRSADSRYLDLALQLVDQVHHTLGKHRPDDERTGWLSGLDEAAGEDHPTAGGLRIGKKFPERRPAEPFDDQLEWERDGQYFHYLTKWMHALDQVARATRQKRFNRWARELAQVSHGAFAQGAPRGTHSARMAWKMSIDLSRPLVPSMGQHDPLEGWITCLQLRATAAALSDGESEQPGPDLEEETAAFAAMARGGDWATADPLGIGGLLVDAYRVQQLIRKQACPNPDLLPELLDSAGMGLRYYRQRGGARGPASRRLAFRELGLAIGLATTGRADERSMADQITAFWLEPRHQQQSTWTSHRDINEVMLATDLAPEGFVSLGW